MSDDEKVDGTVADRSRQDDVLAALLIDPATRQQLHESHISLFDGEARQDIATYLMQHQEVIDDTPRLLQKHDTYVKILLLRADTRYAAWDAKDRALEVARLLRQCITEHNKLKREQLIAELRDAEDQGDDERSHAIRAELNRLIKEIKHG